MGFGKSGGTRAVAVKVNDAAPVMTFELYSSSFCGACRQTAAVLGRASQLIPGSEVAVHDVAAEPDLAESERIDATPTVIVRAANGAEVMRASGVPTIDHILVAATRALDAV
jgi:thiol-disulfide isomerase/thioredoxin